MLVSHSGGAAEHGSAAVAADNTAMPVNSGVPAASTAVSTGSAPGEILACDGDLAGACTAMGVACLLVLTILSVLVAAARPVTLPRLLPSAVPALRARLSSAAALPPPSLIALCVSRT